MKRKVFLIPMLALAGVSLPFALDNDPIVVRAEDESISIVESVEDISSADSVLQIETTEEQGLEEKIAELEKQLQEKFNELQKSKVYAIVVEVGAVVYMLWGVLDKFLQKHNIKIAKDLSVDNFKAIESVIAENELLNKICTEIKADYGKATEELAKTKEELEKTAETIEVVIEQNKELAEQLYILGKAFLELCKNDPSLIEGSAYKKVERVLNGAETDE